ncbi:MAG: hypothetical protein FRX49_05573 [Trebouxia sp. A1-2]|nr:MAG: hypothetical protein FRX49_05573 [Trebouxia sp. A1-2]
MQPGLPEAWQTKMSDTNHLGLPDSLAISRSGYASQYLALRRTSGFQQMKLRKIIQAGLTKSLATSKSSHASVTSSGSEHSLLFSKIMNPAPTTTRLLRAMRLCSSSSLRQNFYAVNAPVNDKPHVLVSAQTLQSAFGENVAEADRRSVQRCSNEHGRRWRKSPFQQIYAEWPETVSQPNRWKLWSHLLKQSSGCLNIASSKLQDPPGLPDGYVPGVHLAALLKQLPCLS